jgi:hypothetical protein
MLRTEYVTRRPPVFEVVTFPDHPDRQSVKEFQEWGGFTSSRKRAYEQVWDFQGRTETGMYHVARPGQRFFRPVGADQYTYAKPYTDWHEKGYQEVAWKRVEFTTEIGDD